MIAPFPRLHGLLVIGMLFFSSLLSAQVVPISFSNQTNLLLTDNYSGVCMAVADMNADGKDDIIRYNYGRILNIEYQTAPNQPFSHYNHGAISNFSEWSNTIADVDGNGYNDLLVGGKYTNIKLLYNQNAASYTRTTLPNSNFFVQGTNFIDFDNDGAVDIFACNDDGDNKEYINYGSGQYSFAPDVIDTKTAPASDNSGNYGSTWTDYDNDGDMDLYISKCKAGVNDPSDPRRINMLFRNDGAAGFTEVAAQVGLAMGEQTWLTDFADIDNDGDMDVFVGNHYDDCKLLLNNGQGQFIDITRTSGLLPTLSANQGIFVIQAIFRDFNNDGYVDLMFSGSQHFLFYNNGDRTFSGDIPFDSNQIESFALGDLNHDGFLDLYAGYAEFFTLPSTTKDALFINEGNDNNFIALNLTGTESNTNAIGAKVSIYGDFGMQIREVRAGEGYGIMNSFSQHFGLGQSTSVSRIEILWPSGILQIIDNPTINQYHYITEELPCANQPCNDGDACTINDTTDANCNCIGTFEDSDNDGVCDTEDVCAGYDDNQDSDGDGLPDGCDSCATLDDSLIGQQCDDSNPCTVGETYDSNCNCSGGTVLDNDNDGVCDAQDACPGADDMQDSDNDGTPNGCDTCPNLNDNLIGQPCDDGNDCTTGEQYDANCNCSGGQYTDLDNDGYCAGEDSNDNNPCIPDASLCYPDITNNTDCTELSRVGFEDDEMGIWIDGGNGGRLLRDENFSASGVQTFYIQGDLGSVSSLSSEPLLLAAYTGLKLSFSLFPYSMEARDKFHVELATNGGSYVTIQTFETNIDFINANFKSFVVDITGYTLTNNTSLRFRAETTESSDYIMLDDIVLHGCTSGQGPDCQVGNSCDDGDVCTAGSFYDSNCNCIGGSLIDSDNDGICDMEDNCPNLNNNLIGQPCNDGDSCTVGETFDANCGCSGGVATDTDNDGFCASLDPDDNDPCVPVSGAGCTPDVPNNTDDCQIYSFADFENNDLDIWIDGGVYARLVSGSNFANSGIHSFYIQGNGEEQSSLISRPQDLSGASSLVIDFNVLPYSVEVGDAFVLELSTNGIYNTIATYRTGAELVDNIRKFISLRIDDITFSSSTQLRFRSVANSDSDYFVLDDIQIQTCQEAGTGPSCNIGSPCNDGDACTIGETFDANCNCTGGQYQDADNDGICDNEDNCPNFDDRLIGQPCDDNNSCTIGETFDANCGCSGGIYTDNDNDGICIGNDADDNDPCIPNVTASACDQTTTLECSMLYTTDFENAELGIWNDGGANGRLFSGSGFANSGSYSFYIQGNDEVTSTLYTEPINLASYEAVNIEFYVFAYSVEAGDKFYLELSTGGNEYRILRTYNYGQAFNDGDRLIISETLANLNFSATSSLRFRAASLETSDYFIFDDIKIEGCQNQTGPTCNAGTACDDNDACTTGETYDDNCNCTGGTYIDADNDGYCAAFDIDDTDPCLPDNSSSICNTTTNNLDCQLVSSVDFEGNNLGIWNDGGSSARILNSSDFANSGNYLFYLQGDGNEQSSLYSDQLTLAGVEAVRLNFNYLAFDVEDDEKFHVEISNGYTYAIYKTYRNGVDFNNNERVDESLVISNVSFNNNFSIRFRLEGNNSTDYLMLDDISLELCDALTITNRQRSSADIAIETQKESSGYNLYPNPTSGLIHIENLDQVPSEGAILQVYDLQGKLLTSKSLVSKQEQLNLADYPSGQVYLFRILNTDDSSYSYKVFKQ